MIDIEKAKEEFLKYTNTYDLNNNSIQRKVEHSLRVMEESKYIAESLKLSKEEIQLAELIGLLHDIGRFEQMKVYKTFIDKKSIDHGDLGVDILEENNLIRKFINIDKYDFIIKAAVKNHNKFMVERELDDYTKLFCNIIRDADKIDILYEGTEIFWSTEEAIKEVENGFITDESYKEFINEMTVKKNNNQTRIDQLVIMAAFVYDMNFEYSIKKIYDKNYISIIIDRFNFKNKETIERMKNIKIISNEFLKNKLNFKR